ncbi:hypothetical protein RM533_09860 [Croceicoccus sp. F390]|uniref:Uncharacterized protein n=1 Tax=Croceicoccus esteveae TaxID=3075597 RepID=A0ABU2ZIQ2_9SPHN|nr:hypothetical protein [Croceicoccus sp. F390]MDT0576492.1 hypothetical protein [Croceicoccus sp. F390]
MASLTGGEVEFAAICMLSGMNKERQREIVPQDGTRVMSSSWSISIAVHGSEASSGT